MAFLNSFLAELTFAPTVLLKYYLENGIPVHLQPTTLHYRTPTDWCLKSSSKSSELRDRGNDAYHSKKYDEALKYYCQSIATAPTDSTELALAYGNRSTILQVQKEYELCLLDTNRALDGTIPQSSRTTLLERKAKCWEKLQEQNVMRTKLRAGLSNLRCNRQLRDNLMAFESQLCYTSEADIDDTDLETDRSRMDGPELEVAWGNEISGYLSPKVQQRIDEERGQAFIAAEDIEPGELLSNDDFYALVVHESEQHEYCSYCSVHCTALIPCVSCSLDMYCCVGCRERAHYTYHETECKMLPRWGRLPESDREKLRLVLRIFLKGTEQGGNLTNLLNDPQVYAALNGNLLYANARNSSKDYLAILNTCWKLDDVPDVVKHYTMMKEVLEIFIGLRYVRYFGADVEIETQCSGNTLTGEELMAVVLLVHNSSISITQRHRVAAHFWEHEGEGPLILTPHSAGTVVGPWHMFLNHSCAPNTTKLASGRRVLCHSLRPIKAGEQIFRTTGILHTQDTLGDRQLFSNLLWGRGCNCVACVGDWPLLSDMLKSRNRYINPNRAVIKKIEKMQKWIRQKIRDSIADEDVKKVIEFSKIACQHTIEPAYPMVLCDTFLRAAMRMRGNLYFSQKYIASLCNYL